MASYNLAPIINPQFIASVAAALTFAPQGGAAVPAGYAYLIASCWVTNVTASPTFLTLWLVPTGATNDNQHLINPVTVSIPPATSSNPSYSVDQLVDGVLAAGTAIWALANTPNALTIQASGAVIVP